MLTGAGGTFCAGADLKAAFDGRGIRVAEDGDGPLGISRFALTKPAIAAVEGYAVAGGLELALWCDLRVAADDAVFGVYCRRWGVPLMDGGTVRLPRLIGQSRALDMILTGRGCRRRRSAALRPGEPARAEGDRARRRDRAGARAGAASAAPPAQRSDGRVPAVDAAAARRRAELIRCGSGAS